MVIFNKYENNIDKTWYQSSNVVYSECEDKVNDYKELKVVFKNGSTYVYHKLDVKDYLMFRNASSQGKALNEYIKKYEYEKCENSDLTEINNELLSLIEENNEKSKIE